MGFTDVMIQKAKEMKKRLVLPEGCEVRTQRGAEKIVKEGIASEVALIGDRTEIEKCAQKEGIDSTLFTIINPKESLQFKAYSEEFYNLRKAKGITMDQAAEAMQDPLNFGAMMVRLGDSDAMVAGAENSTGNVLRAGFTIVKTAPGIKTASSCFVMDFPNTRWGDNGLMIFADCATIPDPTAEQLAEITIQSAQSCRTFIGVEPIVAMLSFSTKGSASHPNVDKVVEALAIVKEKEPGLNVDGELQLDAAIVESVGASKAPGSKVAGKANTLIFPDLQSGNIGYKLVQRFAGAGAYGPFLQGFAKPVSDLSRGCSVEDIVNTAAVTMTQAG